jgi:hypothetical protein
LPSLLVLAWCGEVQSQERRPDEVTELSRAADESTTYTHLGHLGPSQLLTPYDDFLDELKAKHGLGFAVTYSPIYQVGGPGGSHNMTVNQELAVYVDWTVFDHPIFGKGRVDLYAYQQADNFTGTDTALFADHVGSSWLLSDADADGVYTSLATLWWEQLLFDDHLDITFGQLDPILLFDLNLYAGWDRGSFIAEPLSGNPVRNFAEPGLGVYLAVQDLDIAYVNGTVMDADADGRYPDFESLGNGRWAYLLEAGLTPTIPSLGLFEFSVTLNAIDRTRDGPASEGLLISLSQDFGERFSFFMRYGLNDGKRTDIEEMVSVGVVFKGIFQFTGDWIGAAFMWGHPADSSLRDQFGIEAYWRLQLRDRVQFTPDLQVIVHPSGRPHSKTEFVGGLRILISL